MTLILSGTDNSVSSPAVQGGTGGTTTGVYYPATNQLALATNGTQAVLVDSSQNVGIGITPVSQKLEVKGNQRLVGDSAYILWRDTADSASSGVIQFPSASVATIGTYVNQAMLFQTNNTERMRIFSSGAVTIGESTSYAKFAVRGFSGTSGSYNLVSHFGDGVSGNSAYIVQGGVGSNTVGLFSDSASGILTFGTNFTERMRIDSAGKITNSGAAYFNPANGTSTGLQQYSYASYNDNSSHTLAGFSSVYMVVAITTTGIGQSYIPVFGNAGGGVAYAYSYMHPTTGWAYSSNGINISFTNAGSSQNTYNFIITGGGASISIQRTSGTTSYSAAIFLYISN